MRLLIKNLFLALTSVLSLGCSNGASTLTDKDCLDNLAKANSHLNDYYIDGNKANLNLSLSIVDSVFELCPDNKGQLVNLKITLMTLLKDYDKGFEFVSTLESDKFEKPYQRNMYLKTFKALSLEVKGDILKRNEILQELVDEMQSYVNGNPTDKNAITDLFYTKIKYKSKEDVIEEINRIQQDTETDKDFYEALKESIEFAPEM